MSLTSLRDLAATAIVRLGTPNRLHRRHARDPVRLPELRDAEDLRADVAAFAERIRRRARHEAGSRGGWRR